MLGAGGSTPQNPAELLASSRLRALIWELRDRADFVVVDAAPLLSLADAAAIAPACDAVLFVVVDGSTTRAQLLEAREQLDRTHSTLIGCVLLNARVEHMAGHPYR